MPSFLQRLFTFSQFSQQAYRYGISFACIGVLLNWLGVAQAHMAPIRYLGIGLVIFGALLVIIALFRWMFGPFASESNNNMETELHSITVNELQPLQVIALPVRNYEGSDCHTLPFMKPPDYFMVVDKPPSYEEAMSVLPPSVEPVNIHGLPVSPLGNQHSIRTVDEHCQENTQAMQMPNNDPVSCTHISGNTVI